MHRAPLVSSFGNKRLRRSKWHAFSAAISRSPLAVKIARAPDRGARDAARSSALLRSPCSQGENAPRCQSSLCVCELWEACLLVAMILVRDFACGGQVVEPLLPTSAGANNAMSAALKLLSRLLQNITHSPAGHKRQELCDPCVRLEAHEFHEIHLFDDISRTMVLIRQRLYGVLMLIGHRYGW